jgi:hypothetical protein
MEDEETGGKLVSLVTREGKKMVSGVSDGMVEMKTDLKRWQSIARRNLKNGESPAYDFESDHITPEVKADILEALEGAETEEEVKAAFFAPFCLDWEGYP